MSRKTFFELEASQKKKLLILFAILLVLYVVGIFVVTAIGIFFLAIYNPQIFFDGLFLYLLIPTFIASFVVCLIHWIYSMRNGRKKIVDLLEAMVPDREDRYHLMYQNTVEEIRIAMGQPNIDALVIPSASLNAMSLAVPGEDDIIAVTEGAISRLSRPQLQSMVAQAVARCATGEALITTATCSLAGMYETVLERMGDAESKAIKNVNRGYGYQNQGADAAIFLVLLKVPIIMLHFCFTLFNLFLSRENGLRADAMAVRLGRDPQAMAEALHICDKSWRGAGIGGPGLAPLFALPGGTGRSDEDNSSIFDSHPPTSKRIDILLGQAGVGREVLNNAYSRFEQVNLTPVHVTPASTEEQSGWMVREGDDWKGPMGLPDIMGLSFLTPHTWVRLGTNIYPALSIPGLAGKFENQDIQVEPMRRGSCPNCDGHLSQYDRDGVRVRRCYKCKGFLVRNNQIPRLLLRREEEYSNEVAASAQALPSWEEWKKNAENQKAPSRYCPDCNKLTEKRPYSFAYPVEVNRCDGCNLTWFDDNEIDIIQYLVAKSRQDRSNWH